MFSRHSRQLLENLEPRVLLSADAVITWNSIAIDAIRNVPAVHAGPTWVSRAFAMVQGAIFDAVNAITHDSPGYLLKNRLPKFASLDAAVAQAAHDVLISLLPEQRSTLDAALANSLQSTPHNPQQLLGTLAGKLAAKQMLHARLHDNAIPDSPYTASTLPGHWQPDPMNPSQSALGVDWGFVTPFILPNFDAIHVPAVPDMASPEYTAAFNEVKNLGGNGTTTPTTRTAEQTEIGIFWAYDIRQLGSPVALYNQILQTIAQQQHNTLEQNAKLFALANFAMADAAILTWHVKWTDVFWRPVTAIRNADADNNPDTIADPAWIPLGAPGDGFTNDFTPPFPAYPSGHAAFGAATFTTLQDFYHTDNIAFTLHSDEFNPALTGRGAGAEITRSYTSFSQAMNENAQSRIYLGIHWQFDATTGISLGQQVATQILSTAF